MRTPPPLPVVLDLSAWPVVYEMFNSEDWILLDFDEYFQTLNFDSEPCDETFWDIWGDREAAGQNW